MGEPTDEMVDALFERASGGEFASDADVRHGIASVVAIAERQIREAIAYRSRAELVCCDLYERTHDNDAWEKAASGPHSICYWSEAAARLAEREG